MNETRSATCLYRIFSILRLGEKSENCYLFSASSTESTQSESFLAPESNLVRPISGAASGSGQSKEPAKRMQHFDATSSNIVESLCCLMLDDVEGSLFSIKHRLQRRPSTSFLFSGMNNSVVFVWPPC